MTTVSVKIRPLGDRVVVKPLSSETVTKSGIVLPDTAKEKPQEGEILAVGPGKVLDNGKRTTLEVSVGQKAAMWYWTRSSAHRPSQTMALPLHAILNCPIHLRIWAHSYSKKLRPKQMMWLATEPQPLPSWPRPLLPRASRTWLRVQIP